MKNTIKNLKNYIITLNNLTKSLKALHKSNDKLLFCVYYGTWDELPRMDLGW